MDYQVGKPSGASGRSDSLGDFAGRVANQPPLVRFAIAAFIFFAPLYLLASAGHTWAGGLAVLGFASIVLYRYGTGKG